MKILTQVALGTVAGETAATGGLFGTAGKFAIAPTLKTAGVGLGVIGAVTQGRADQARLRSEENIDRFNAQVQLREKTAIKQKAVFESKRAARTASRREAEQTVATAKKGIAGSPVAPDLAAAQAAEDELEQLLIAFEGEIGARRAQAQADIDLTAAGITRQKRKSAKAASRIKIGRTLLTGF